MLGRLLGLLTVALLIANTALSDQKRASPVELAQKVDALFVPGSSFAEFKINVDTLVDPQSDAGQTSKTSK